MLTGLNCTAHRFDENRSLQAMDSQPQIPLLLDISGRKTILNFEVSACGRMPCEPWPNVMRMTGRMPCDRWSVLIGIRNPPPGRSSYYISCPCCDSGRKKYLNISLTKERTEVQMVQQAMLNCIVRIRNAGFTGF